MDTTCFFKAYSTWYARLTTNGDRLNFILIRAQQLTKNKRKRRFYVALQKEAHFRVFGERRICAGFPG